jgi:uncharacterized protein YbjT (DUF2867 family)
MITVMGATGHTGKKITEALLNAGEKVRALGRSESELTELKSADEANALAQAGVSESFARLYAEMTRAFNEGTVKPRDGRTAANTTPTRFEDFAGELASAYDAA